MQAVSELLALLQEQMAAVRADPEAEVLDKARVIGNLAGTALKAIEIGSLAARIEMLETVLKARDGEAKP